MKNKIDRLTNYILMAIVIIFLVIVAMMFGVLIGGMWAGAW